MRFLTLALLLLTPPAFAQGVLVPTFGDLPAAYDDSELRTRIETIEATLEKIAEAVQPKEPPVIPDPIEPDPAPPVDPPVVPDPPGTKQFITADDFDYLGEFRPAHSGYPHGDLGFASGLTHRRVDGELRLFTILRGLSAGSGKPHVVEFTVPDPIDGNSVLIEDHTGLGNQLNNWFRDIHWDEGRQRVWFTILDNYNTKSNDYTIGSAKLDGTEHGGLWRLPMSYKATKGFAAVPSRRIGNMPEGQTILAGFGGYESIIASGPASMGPAIASFDPDALLALEPGQSASTDDSTTFIEHGYNADNDPPRGLRNGYYRDELWGQPQPEGDVGFWSTRDHVKSGCAVWIDTVAKHGFLIWINQAQGNETAKVTEVTKHDGGKHWWVLTTESPLENAVVGQVIRVPVVKAIQNDAAGQIKSIDGNTITVDIITGEATLRREGGDPTPIVGVIISRGVWYEDSRIHSTMNRCTVQVYDPDLILSSPERPLPYQSESAWLSVGQRGFGHDAAVEGATFDEESQRLFLLFQGGRIGVWGLR